MQGGLNATDATKKTDRLGCVVRVLERKGSPRRSRIGRYRLYGRPLRAAFTHSYRVRPRQAEYEALLRVAGEVDWRFKVALVLAHETGHRIGAIRQLLWSDIEIVPGRSGGGANMRRPATSTARR